MPAIRSLTRVQRPAPRRSAMRQMLPLAALTLLAACAQAPRAMLFAEAPKATLNPNPKVPQAALLSVTTSQAAAITVEIDDGGQRQRIAFPEAAGARNLPLLGLKSGRNYRLTVSATPANGAPERWPLPLALTTPQAPAAGFHWPYITVRKAEAGRMEPGLTIVSVRRRVLNRTMWFTPAQMKFTRGWGLLLALEAKGEVVWSYQSDVRTAGIERLANGNLLLTQANFTTVEIDMLGNRVGAWTSKGAKNNPTAVNIPPGAAIVDVEALHHQPESLPGGTFLGFAADPRRLPNYYTSEYDPKAPRKEQLVVGDRIVEYDRQGKILWDWNSWDHLDPKRIGYELTENYWQTRGFTGALDWTHGNGLSYREADNSILASFRNQDASIKIDKATGAIKWILGEPSDWGKLTEKVLKPVGPLRWPYHGHNPRFTAAGTVIMFDNGLYQARPFRPFVKADQFFSRAVEFEVDEQAMTVRQVWSSGDDPGADACRAGAMGDAHRLPQTNNILVIWPMCPPTVKGASYIETSDAPLYAGQLAYRGRIREYTRTMPAEILFDAEIGDPYDVMQWELFGGFKVPSLYGPGVTVSPAEASGAAAK